MHSFSVLCKLDYDHEGGVFWKLQGQPAIIRQVWEVIFSEYLYVFSEFTECVLPYFSEVITFLFVSSCGFYCNASLCSIYTVLLNFVSF